MAKHAGAYKSDKRRKEVLRQKKQEEKRQRRLQKGDSFKKDSEVTDSEGMAKEQENEKQE